MPNGRGRGQGGGVGRGGTGRGRGQRGGMGPQGNCVCPKCGTKAPHKPGVPCMQVKCPNCGSQMVRD